MAEAVLEVRHLRKRFGALTVTDDVSITVLAGTIHAVIGPNGAGKTSLVHQISGILAPDAGTVWLCGREVTQLPLHRRARLGLARGFQITSVLPEFSVLENVALAVQARAGSSFRFFYPAAREAVLNARAQAALARVGLGTRADAAARLLSHGEKRQLELAMALAAEPRLLLLDEPLAGAGPEETARLVELLDGLRHGCAMLLVEHDMDAVFRLADTVTVLDQGRVIASGRPAAIRDDAVVRAAYLGEDFEFVEQP